MTYGGLVSGAGRLRVRLTATRLASLLSLGHLLVGVLWIYGSGQSLYGGWAFVVLSAALIFGVLREVFRHLQLTEAQRARSERMEAMTRMAAGVAHDINNTLAVVIGTAELELERLGPENPTGEGQRMILESGRRGRELAQQLMQFARMESLPLTPPVAVDAVILRCEAFLRSFVPLSVRFVVEVEPGAGSVRIAPTRMEQVLMNLVINACHAMPAGGELSVRARQERSWVRIEVRDNGAGIDPRSLPHIFEPFFSTKGPGGGQGLGLSVVYGIIRQAEGSVDVESRPGQGTNFILRFPRTA